MNLSRIREELCQLRRQILRQRKEIQNLHRGRLAGRRRRGARADGVAAHCGERARQEEEQGRKNVGIKKALKRAVR
jgi:hypothetical protein